MVGGLRGARNDGILEIIGRPWKYREVKGLENVKEITWEYVSLLPKVTEQLIKYLKNKFVSPLSTEITCDAVNYYFFIPCSPAICGFVIISKSFVRDLTMLTQTKLIKPAPV